MSERKESLRPEAEPRMEEGIQEDEIVRQRKDKLERLLSEEGYNPYLVEKWERTHPLSYVRDHYSHLGEDELDESLLIVTAGRIMTVRKHGRAIFANLADETDNLQLYFQFDVMGEEPFTFVKKWVDTGDWLGVRGYPFRTRRGELTIHVREAVLLCKALRPLPEKWHGLKDTEIRYRRRYMDLIANPAVREVFRKRSKILSSIRKTLEDHGTIEVETPILSVLAGGANARPFKTFHNALGLDMYLRIATELYLKRLVVGMFGRVYEMGKNFRNEGIDATHNPEFTCMEVYWPYADYEDMMTLTEEIIRNAAEVVVGPGAPKVLPFQDVVIDYDKPFKRATMAALVKEHTGVDFGAITDDGEARAIAASRGVELKGGESRFMVLTLMFEAFVEDKLVQPTFVTDHPTEVSPLAKRNPHNPDYTHRFELFICGKEVANAFSELNDPIDQRMRFEDQLRKKEAGDEEAHDFDEDFINAIEMGLPPTGGLGVGVDRLVMFLTDSRSIRDVLFFPAMKPLDAPTPEDQRFGGGDAETCGQCTTDLKKLDLSRVRVEPLFEDLVDFETFSKSDFRVVKVVHCEEVPKSSKLLKFTLNDGSGTERIILSGIKEYYTADDLIGKTLVAITNLPERKMMGIPSQGMIISAVYEYDGKEGLDLLILDDTIPAGAKLY